MNLKNVIAQANLRRCNSNTIDFYNIIKINIYNIPTIIVIIFIIHIIDNG